MENPWKHIRLDDYENHMRLDSVLQLQALNDMMRGQLRRYAVPTVMILGVAGGNGLCHIRENNFQTVYGVDINPAYLAACRARYASLQNIFQPVEADLSDPDAALPHAGLVIADLLVEYIGCEAFCRAVLKVGPTYLSCIIQRDAGPGFVSDSPYLPVLGCLEGIHHRIEADRLTDSVQTIGYHPVFTAERTLPNGKKLVWLDYSKNR